MLLYTKTITIRSAELII